MAHSANNIGQRLPIMVMIAPAWWMARPASSAVALLRTRSRQAESARIFLQTPHHTSTNHY
jgi:hypothetical protein